MRPLIPTRSRSPHRAEPQARAPRAGLRVALVLGSLTVLACAPWRSQGEPGTPAVPNAPAAAQQLATLLAARKEIFWVVATREGLVCQAWALADPVGTAGFIPASPARSSCFGGVSHQLHIVVTGDQVELAWEAVSDRRAPSAPEVEPPCPIGQDRVTLPVERAESGAIVVGGDRWFSSRSACESHRVPEAAVAFRGFACTKALIENRAKLEAATGLAKAPVRASALLSYAERMRAGGSLFWFRSDSAERCSPVRFLKGASLFETREPHAGRTRRLRYSYSQDEGCPRITTATPGDEVMGVDSGIVGTGGKEPLDIVLTEAIDEPTPSPSELFLSRDACATRATQSR